MAPGQEKYVTSEGIEKIRRDLQGEAIPFFEDVKARIDDTDVGAPAFGLLGMLFVGPAYSAAQEDMRGYMDDAVDVMESWRDALEDIKRVWRAAEDFSTPTMVEGPDGPVRVDGPAVYG